MTMNINQPDYDIFENVSDETLRQSIKALQAAGHPFAIETSQRYAAEYRRRLERRTRMAEEGLLNLCGALDVIYESCGIGSGDDDTA